MIFVKRLEQNNLREIVALRHGACSCWRKRALFMAQEIRMARKLIALALQGGGSHGAYTWGVLDRLLERGGSEIEAISGASAGAMNAAVLAHGYCVGGREGAREAL